MIESSSESRNRDRITFESSLKQLHDNLLRDYVDDDRSVIISMSRKGPKIMDIVFSDEERKHLNVVTEFAIPIIFRKMKKDVEYRIYVVDDAIYYGSTLLNLFREISEYQRVYELKFEVFGAYVAIQDRGAIVFDSYNVYGNSDLREGYGHYFVREIMSLFRSHHRCMEVEYPVITYILDDELNFNQLRLQMKSHYKTFYEEIHKEETVLNVLLEQGNSQFSKYRLYPDGKKLHVAFMCPRIIPNTGKMLKELMKEMPYSIKTVWEELCSIMLDDEKSIKFTDGSRRNMYRNLVSIANYIYSYQEYIYYKSTIDNLLAQSDNKVLSCDLKESALYYLLGDHELASKLKIALAEQTRLLDFHFPDILFSTTSDNAQLYEELRFPSQDERTTLEAHNTHMIRNSLSFNEALSAVFFNQNIFIERWSRHNARYEGRRLWFGYTHDALLAMLKKNTRLDLPEQLDLFLHQWLDYRIDQGCVVPQYILDSLTNQWARVFRPGENEEIMLSHLSRFVLHIYKIIDRRIGMGYVPRLFLNNMLAVVYRKFWHSGLSEQFDFELELSQDNVLCLSNEYNGNCTEVIKLLRKMYIIELDDDEVTIAPRISDPDFQNQSTLDFDMQKKVDGLVYTVLAKFHEADVPISNSQSIFNFYLNENIPEDFLISVYRETSVRLKHVISMIEKKIDSGNHEYIDDESRDILLEAFRFLSKYDINQLFYLGNSMLVEEYWHRFDNDVRFRCQTEYKRLIYILNIIVSVFAMADANSFFNFVTSSDQQYLMTMLKLDDLKPFIDQAVKEKSINQLQHTHYFTGTLKSILSKIESE